MTDPTPPLPPSEDRPHGHTACEACRKRYPADYRYCPHCARTLRAPSDSLEQELGMALPARFNGKFILVLFLILALLSALGIWRLSQIPAVPPPDPTPRAAQTAVETRFASDLAKLGYTVSFKGPDRALVAVPRDRWDALGNQARFARHGLVGDFRRALGLRQRELGDATDYRIEIRDPASGDLLAEETDFNLKVYK